MNNFLKKLSLLLLAAPCSTFALGLNSYFQQGFSIINLTKQSITTSDNNSAVAYFQNIVTEPVCGETLILY